MSFLVRRNPQAFLDFLYPGCIFVRFHDTKLANTQRQPDVIMEVYWLNTGVHFLVQLEWQTYLDLLIAERQLLYRVLILWQPEPGLQLPVWPKTLNLTGKAEKDLFPVHLPIPGPNGEELPGTDFSGECIYLIDKTPEEILALGHPELFVLLPCTCGGASIAIVELMISRLQPLRDPDLLIGGFTMADLACRAYHLDELRERFKKRRKNMINDEILLESELGQELIARGKAEGEAKAEMVIQEIKANAAAQVAQAQAQAAHAQAAQAQAEAKLQAEARAKAQAEAEVKIQLAAMQTVLQTQQKIVQLVTKRFLSLAAFASDLLIKISKPDLLIDLFSKLAMADNAEEAEQYLRSTQAALA